jgi:Flp pilus assembly protein TadG
MTMRRPDRERGSVAPMMIGFLMILVLLLVVVVGASKAFLVQRQLAAAADAATLAGADGFDTSEIYGGTGAGDVGLDSARACALARESFTQNVAGLPAAATYVTSCVTAGRRITIKVTSRADLPVLNKLVPAALTVNAQSSAEGRS